MKSLKRVKKFEEQFYKVNVYMAQLQGENRKVSLQQ